MNRWIIRLLGLGLLATLLLVGLKQEARAQQGQERSPELDQLFNLDSYQGFEETSNNGAAPGVDELAPVATYVNVSYSYIVFQSARIGNGWELFLTDGSGSSQAQLTWNSVPDIHARLNRGCTKIVYATKRPANNYNIYIMNADSSGDTQLTMNNKDDVYPAWSLDGTKIAFQAYRDGNPEIYIMNADGSGQTRLTNNPKYDGTPAWSPDGRIVFASDRVGSGGIWVMNADGSGLTQLASQPYSIFPAWSPDGSQIAYSADNDGDGWLEMWLMNADGSNQHQIVDLGFQNDTWVRSWSPDGQYIANTQITYIVYQGNLYWTRAYLYATDIAGINSSRIINNDTEWNPDWQSTDMLPPTSIMNVLPPQSPASFLVSWSGYDNGPTGLRNYDVQVKDGAGAVWTDWMMATTATSAYYQGVGGHNYYFRLRARDNAWNQEAWPDTYDAMTMVENLPPRAWINPLADYLKRGDSIGWAGIDPGGSGINLYQVQYRNLPDGNWTDWFTGTRALKQYFYGDVGQAYSFRTRAVDYANNLGAWSSENDATSTILYQWGIWGAVHDNSGVPLANVDINTTPEAFVKFTSNEQGKFAAYILESENYYSVDWRKHEYGDLPVTNFSANQDKQIDVVLPPSNNLVNNWGFETINPDTGWVFRGLTETEVITSVQHTGARSVLVGAQGNGFASRIMVSSPDRSSISPQIAADELGYIHTIWIDGVDKQILYARRDLNGQWSTPENISKNSYTNQGIQMVVDQVGTVHVIWLESDANHSRVLYSSRNETGWITPIIISDDYENGYVEPPQFTVTTNGVAHIVWSPLWSRIVYTQCHQGICSIPQPLPGNAGGGDLQIGYDPLYQKVHLIWQGEATDSHGSVNEIFYAGRDVNGNWSEPLRLTYSGENYRDSVAPQIAVDGLGVVHVTWREEGGGYYTIRYTQRDANGVWLDPEDLFELNPIFMYMMKADNLGRTHIVLEYWQVGSWPNLYYLQRTLNGVWTPLEQVSFHTQFGANNGFDLVIDHNDELYMVWPAGQSAFDMILYFAKRDTTGHWSEPVMVSTDTLMLIDIPKIAVDANSKSHIIWSDSGNIYYIGPDLVHQSSNSQVSQAVTIPPTITAPILSFFFQLEGASADGGSSFSVSINNGLTTTLLSTSANTTDWTHAWFDLSPWLSQTITLTFNVHEVEGYPYTWAYLDEVTIGSAHPDAWVSLSGNRAAMPGQQVILQLTYGNRSPAVEALSATITATLPAGLIFDSASLTPTVNGNVLTWSVGDLPPGSGPFTILVTASVADDTAPGSTITLPVEISTATPELELLNNQQDYALFIGGMVYLPVTVR